MHTNLHSRNSFDARVKELRKSSDASDKYNFGHATDGKGKLSVRLSSQAAAVVVL